MKHADLASEFTANIDRAHWHDQALWFVRTKRDRAANALPEWESLRTMASQLKQHTLAQLDEYLVQFEANAKSLGVQVHWARDAKEHNEIALQILKSRGVRRIVKSKSMLTEECHLNPFLQTHSIEVTDTDLGEWIVQLRDEPPSHIVMPAIHIRKQEVGELFHDRLGTPAGETDPAFLTNAARQRLRSFFHRADAGITGVNFAIADTGGIVVCTNEGNADLGAALPPVHIACMGIEKVIPRLVDLGVFTRLLARSATGQPITVYTSHFHGPRPGGELHIIVLDNGRTRLLANPDYQSSLKCIRCGACLNTCPVYRRSGGHSYGATVAGPIGSIINPARHPELHASLPFACSLCGSCSDVCPVRIDLHQQLLTLRRDMVTENLVPLTKRWSMRVATWMMSRPWLYRLTTRIANRLSRWSPRWMRDAGWNRWTRQRELPTWPAKSFRDSVHDQLR